MSKKKPLSAEEKRERLLELFHETGGVFQLKDLERIAPVEKGIVMQSVKTTLMELVDNGDVRSEKISGSVYFWSFPNDALVALKQKLEYSQLQNDEMQKRIDNSLVKLTESEATTPEETKNIAALEAEIETLKRRKCELETRLKASTSNLNYAEVSEKEKSSKPVLEAANRWTDNIFSIKSWCKKKFGKEEREMNKAFGIPEDLDYVVS